MAIHDITTGTQTVTGTGAVTGTLDTSAMTGDFTLKVRIKDTPASNNAGDNIRFAFEDTANSSAFSDATTVATVDYEGGAGPEGNAFNFRQYEIPSIRFGVTHTKVRLNCTVISAGSFDVHAWLED